MMPSAKCLTCIVDEDMHLDAIFDDAISKVSHRLQAREVQFPYFNFATFFTEFVASCVGFLEVTAGQDYVSSYTK